MPPPHPCKTCNLPRPANEDNNTVTFACRTTLSDLEAQAKGCINCFVLSKAVQKQVESGGILRGDFEDIRIDLNAGGTRSLEVIPLRMPFKLSIFYSQSEWACDYDCRLSFLEMLKEEVDLTLLR